MGHVVGNLFGHLVGIRYVRDLAIGPGLIRTVGVFVVDRKVARSAPAWPAAHAMARDRPGPVFGNEAVSTCSSLSAKRA